MNARLSIDELRLIAHAELMRNPSITVYTMVDGVERRRFANPIPRFRAAIADMAEGFRKLGIAAEAATSDIVNQMQAVWR